MGYLDYSGLSHFLDKLKTIFPNKPSSSTNGNVATLDANGNLVDSGKTLGKSVPSDAVFTDNDTKNTAGTTNKTDTKMFIVGATGQSANPQTYSNSNVYIGTDNCLYSGGTKVLTSHQSISGKADKVSGATSGNVATLDANGNLVDSGKTLGKSVPSDAVFTDNDTKNTAGTTNKTGTKMFLAGATEQSANPQTYSNSNVYIGTDNCLYSGGTKVLTAHQDISGKADKSTSLSLMATAANWSGGSQTISATGVTASNNILVGAGSMTSSQQAAMVAAQMMCTAQGTNSITLKCYGTVPSVDLPIIVMILG